MKLKPGSLAFVIVYASFGATLGFGIAWLLSNTAPLTEILTSLMHAIKDAANRI